MKKWIVAIALLFAASAAGASVRPENRFEKKFFEQMKAFGFARDLYRVDRKSPFLAGIMFSKLEPSPLKSFAECAAVFCRDVELQKRLNAEIRRGRLVLVTDAFQGFVGATIAETPETSQLKERLSPDGDGGKNILVITPKTLMTTVAHELTHAEDNETGVLDGLQNRTRGLYREGRLSAANGRLINQFAGEIRAYENEMRFLVKNARPTEYVADESADATRLTVRTAGKRDFILRRLQEIDGKVRGWYLPGFLKAMADEKLRKADRQALARAVRGLLPAAGPYSFEHLVGSRL